MNDSTRYTRFWAKTPRHNALLYRPSLGSGRFVHHAPGFCANGAAAYFSRSLLPQTFSHVKTPQLCPILSKKRLGKPDFVHCPSMYTHTHTPWEDQCEWHRMTRMTGPDCAVMCHLINTHTHTHTHKGKNVRFVMIGVLWEVGGRREGKFRACATWYIL